MEGMGFEETHSEENPWTLITSIMAEQGFCYYSIVSWTKMALSSVAQLFLEHTKTSIKAFPRISCCCLCYCVFYVPILLPYRGY